MTGPFSPRGCDCPTDAVALTCREEWLWNGWRCPFQWRPNDLDLARGSRIRLGRHARMWTGRFSDASSELFRSTNLEGLILEVQDISRTANYSQVLVEDLDTNMLVWINVWCRYNLQRRPTGVRWAAVVTRAD